MNKDEVLEHLDKQAYYQQYFPNAHWNGKDEVKVKCCFHDDKEPSLSINFKTGLFHCFACGAEGSIFDFHMRQNHLSFPESIEDIGRFAGLNGKKKSREVAAYDYTDETGKLIYQVVRFENPKDFRQRRPDEKGGWIWNLEGVKFVPYNLPEVLKAETVYIVEGEKDANTLNKIGLVASTNSGGAEKWKSELNQWFDSKNIIILPDNDEPGRKHALAVAGNLSPIGYSVKIVTLPGLSDKGDTTDWMKDHTRDELLAVVEQTEIWQGKTNTSILDSLFKWNDIAYLDVSIEWALSGLIPEGAINLLFCPGGGGKSWLMMQLSKAIANGESFFGIPTKQTPIYYVDFENPMAVVKDRRVKIGEAENFFYWHLACKIPPPKLDSTEWTLYKELPAGLIVFDTLRASHSLEENNSKDMALILERLKELRTLGFTIVLLHHTSKADKLTPKASTAIIDLADHVLILDRMNSKNSKDFDINDTYRFGCTIKTRFEPNEVFLSFNPEKGFMIHDDPDIEPLEVMQDILKKENKELNQSEFKTLIMEKMKMSDRRVRDLIKKGTEQFWTYREGEKKNSKIYSPCLSDCSLYNSVNKLIKLNQNRNHQNKLTAEKDKETESYHKFDSFTDIKKQTDQTEKQNINPDPDFIPEIDEDL